MLFVDSELHAPTAPAELIVVEGDSAAKAVAAVRDARLQAVFALQGKPMNAARAAPSRLLTSPWLRELTVLLGNAPGTALPFGGLRYERVVIIMDPDADGIHAGALLQIFFYRTMQRLLDERRIWIVHAPWGEVRSIDAPPQLAFHESEFQQLCRTATQGSSSAIDRIRYRGLGSITPSLLARCCVDPKQRRARALTVEDAEQALAVFGANALQSR